VPISATAEVLLGHLRKEAGRIGLELFEEDAVLGDLAERLAVGGARHGDADRAGGAVAGEPDDPHVVAEVLPAELGPDARRLGELQHGLLEFDVTEAVPAGRTR